MRITYWVMTLDYWFYKGSLSSKCITTIKARTI
nr:MAG TPA: hypothetical protein [Caudoviricetes sp.]